MAVFIRDPWTREAARYSAYHPVVERGRCLLRSMENTGSLPPLAKLLSSARRSGSVGSITLWCLVTCHSHMSNGPIRKSACLLACVHPIPSNPLCSLMQGTSIPQHKVRTPRRSCLNATDVDLLARIDAENGRRPMSVEQIMSPHPVSPPQNDSTQVHHNAAAVASSIFA